MITIHKHRKTIDGIEITVFEKSSTEEELLIHKQRAFVLPIKSELEAKINSGVFESKHYTNLVQKQLTTDLSNVLTRLTDSGKKLKKYIDERVAETREIQQTPAIQQVITDQTQPATQQILQQIQQFTTETILNLISNSPIDGNLLAYDGKGDVLVWVQPTDLEPVTDDLDELLQVLEDHISDFENHRHIADDINAGTFPDSQYTFKNEVRARKVTLTNSYLSSQYSIEHNNITNTLDIMYVG